MTISKTAILTTACLVTAIAGQASAGVVSGYSLGNVFQDQLGGATGYPLPSESDGGCDSTNGIGVLACGDAVGLTGASGALGTRGNLFDYVFHVEDSNGASGNYTFLETLTIGGQSGTFDVPYQITFGFASDTIKFLGFHTTVCVGGTGPTCTGGFDYDVSSIGSSLIGFTNKNDDDWAFSGNVTGCVRLTGATCDGTAPRKIHNKQQTNDSIQGGVAPLPEPSGLAILGLSAAALLLVRRRLAH